jgi:hypothetical protein
MEIRMDSFREKNKGSHTRGSYQDKHELEHAPKKWHIQVREKEREKRGNETSSGTGINGLLFKMATTSPPSLTFGLSLPAGRRSWGTRTCWGNEDKREI